MIHPHPEPRTEMAISPEIEAELRTRLGDATPGEWFAEPVGKQAQVRMRAPHYTGGGERVADRIGRYEDAKFIASAHELFLPLLDQIAADRVLIEEAAVGLAEFIAAVETEVNEKGGGGYVLARLTDARAFLAKLRTAVPAEQEKQS